MSNTTILDQVLKAYKKHKRHHRWPVHIVAQASMIAVPAGRVLQNASELKYKIDNQADGEEALKQLEYDAIVTAAECIRFLENLRQHRKGETETKTEAIADNLR